MKITLEQVAQAIYTVNVCAKTTLNPPYFYKLKKEALESLVLKGDAKKIGVDLYKNSKSSRKPPLVSVQVANYYFHIAPKKEDLSNLPYIEEGVKRYNPKVYMALSVAEKIIVNYIKHPNSLHEHSSIKALFKSFSWKVFCLA